MIEKRRRLRGERAQVALHSFKNALDFAGAHDSIHFRNLLEDLIAVPLDQAAGDDELFGRAEFLVLGHFQDGVHGLFLRGLDKAAGIHDKDFRFIGARCEFVARAGESAHHDLAIDKVLRASEADTKQRL